MSSSGARPVRVEVARVGAQREVVYRSASVATEEHETPRTSSSTGCGWPVALRVDVDPSWRSGYYEVVMEIDVGDKVRRDYAFFVVRPTSKERIVIALATNTWHAYNDFGGMNLYTGGTHVSMQRPMAPGYLHKPMGKGRRVTGTGAPDPQNAAHVGYIQLNHLSSYAGSADGPTGSNPSLRGRSVKVLRSASVRTPIWRSIPKYWMGRVCTCQSVTTSTGQKGCATPSSSSSPGVVMPPSSRVIRRCGKSVWRATET